MNEIRIKISCEKCKIHRVSIPVREKWANETESHWYETVCVPAARDNHKQLAPNCTTKEIEVLIPGE